MLIIPIVIGCAIFAFFAGTFISNMHYSFPNE